MLSDEQLILRSRGIGGSDVAAIFGKSKWKTAQKLADEKRGALQKGPQRSKESEAMAWGKRLEPALKDFYEGSERVKLRCVSETIVGGEPWMLANPDWLVAGERIGVEGKTRGVHDRGWGWKEWSNRVPLYYRLQCDWYMAITGYPIWDLVALFGAPYFHARIYRLHRNLGWERQMISTAREFWDECVLKGTPVAEVIPQAAVVAEPVYEKVMPAEERHVALMDEYGPIDDIYRDTKDIRDDLRERIKESMGDSEVIEGDGWKFIYREPLQSSPKIDWEGIASELQAPSWLIEKHTGTGTRWRRLWVRR